MGNEDNVAASNKLQQAELIDRAILLSDTIGSLSEDRLTSEGIELVEQYSSVIDEILSAGMVGTQDSVLRLVAAHARVIEVLETIADHLSTQQREGIQKLKGILRYLDSLPSRVSLSAVKKG